MIDAAPVTCNRLGILLVVKRGALIVIVPCMVCKEFKSRITKLGVVVKVKTPPINVTSGIETLVNAFAVVIIIPPLSITVKEGRLNTVNEFTVVRVTEVVICAREVMEIVVKRGKFVITKVVPINVNALHVNEGIFILISVNVPVVIV